MVMRKSTPARRRATGTKKTKTSGRTGVKSTARTAGARTAARGTTGKKKALTPAERRAATLRVQALDATRALSPEPARATLSAAVAKAVPEACLPLSSATRIVLRAAHNFQGDMDTSLEQAGLITESQRAVFRQGVLDGVLEAGCHISAGAIPNGPSTLLSEVRDAIQAQAS